MSDDDAKRDSEESAETERKSEGTSDNGRQPELPGDVPYMERFFGGTVGDAAKRTMENENGAIVDDTAEVVPSESEHTEISMLEEESLELARTQEPDAMSDEELNRTIEEICLSKAQEFRMLGYEQVSGMDIWECVSDKYHKTGMPPLHRVVNDILSLKVTQFMNWMTISMYKKG
ncbi:post-transcriptional regulator [Paenibacillus sp. GD4]|uniref:post-transcriptional regulator n=1 Tax=Paenibacillus sp. GD4 TaxID=3068890 RepID=UPI0027BA5C5A|nr:post-transcriptional regulator [Paenibacillus sp. GD4]